MKRVAQYARTLGLVCIFLTLQSASAVAAPYAAMVMDARSGKVLHSRNADTRLHPASLTKMMTLYVVFQAIENGEIGVDDVITISRNAAAEPPSKLGLRSGQKIRLRYLIRAAAVKSANDAATALGEAISGSESAFTDRMTRTARALGMSNTTFKNAHGLTASGHLSTARDMTILGRHLFFDYPAYYNIFKRRSTDAGMRTVSNTNRRFLAAYEGADGIKTGYTSAAGFNLVASAERGGERIIATMFGGRSTAQRNARVAELLNMGFERAPTRVAVIPPQKPQYAPNGRPASPKPEALAVTASLRPRARPDVTPATAALIAAIETKVSDVVAEALPVETQPKAPPTETALAEAPLPRPRPELVELAALETSVPGLSDTDALPGEDDAPALEVVERMSTSGGRHWGINVGKYPTRFQAEQVLLKTALSEIEMLDEALRKVVQRNAGFEANFVGMTEDSAAMACRRLTSRSIECNPLGPSG